MMKILNSVLAIAVALSIQAQVAQQTKHVLVLSSDGRYASIDLATRRVVANGEVAELHSLDRLYPNAFSDELFVQSPAAQTSGQEKGQLAVIAPSPSAPELRFARWIVGPRASSLVWAKVVNKDLLLVSWQDEQGRVSTVFYN